MKLNKIASALKKNKIISVFNHPEETEQEQWIGDGAALYRLNGMPKFNADNVLTLFDIPPEKIYDWKRNDKTIEHIEYFADSDPAEIDTYWHNISIDYKDTKYSLFRYKQEKDSGNIQILSIQQKYLMPALDSDYLDFKIRTDEGGRNFLAVKHGFQVVALIYPKPLITENNKDFLDDLNELLIYYKNLDVSGNNEREAES